MKKFAVISICLTLALASSVLAGPDLSIQFDCGNNNGEYTGSESPAHSIGDLTAAQETWNTLTGDTSSGLLDVNGSLLPGIVVDCGEEIDGTWQTTAWDANTQSFGPGDEFTGIYANEMMRDWLNSNGYNKFGIRFKGLGAGKYRVYVMAREYNNPTRTYKASIGLNIVIGTDEIPDGITTDITDSTGVETWDDGKNYVVRDIAVNNSNDWATVILESINDEWASIMGIQIVDLTPWRPYNPTPAEGTLGITDAITLSWDAVATHTIDSYNVYLSGDKDDLAVATPASPSFKGNITTTTKNITGLVKDKNYFWKVEAVTGTDNTDPNNLAGSTIWSFQTELSLPVIDQQPANDWANVGEDATFSVAATDPLGDAMDYQWYKGVSPDPSNPVGANSPELTITATADKFGNTYYCRVLNNNGNSHTDTDSAELFEKILLAHWPLDNLANPTSIVDGSPATTIHGDPELVPGITGDAMFFDGDDGLYTSIENTGDYFEAMNTYCTISCWVKTVPFDSGWTPFICKKGEGSEGWQVRKFDNTDKASFTTRGIGEDDYPISTTDVMDDQWHHVVGVYDGSTKKIYIDGALESQLNASGTIGTTVSPVSIASRVEQDGENWNVGNFSTVALDEIRLYSFPMDAKEVADLALLDTDSVCIQPIQTDLNDDCRVNLEDFALFAAQWLDCNIFPDCVDEME